MGKIHVIIINREWEREQNKNHLERRNKMNPLARKIMESRKTQDVEKKESEVGKEIVKILGSGPSGYHKSLEEIGNSVKCDICNKDYTESNKSGGFIFKNRAYCSDCLGFKPLINEELQDQIPTCSADMSFADFVRDYRKR